MRMSENDATELNRGNRSRVGESLRRLQQNLEQTRQVETVADEQFRVWQERWSARREQIAQRLEMIDSQLEQLSRHNPQRPQLSLVGAADS